MLILHIGMPKTGTTSCQAALSLSAPILENAGINYPVRFRDKEGIAHHLLSGDVLAGKLSLESHVGAFFDELKLWADKHVVISSEAFTNALAPSKLGTFKAFLAQAANFGAVRLVIAERRIDDFFQSMYLHSIKTGELRLPISDYLALRKRWSHDLFSGIAELRRAPFISDLVTLKYQENSDFSARLLSAIVPVPGVADSIKPPKHFNVRLSLKSQICLYHLETIQEMIGLPINRAQLIRDFEKGRIEFDNDLHSYSVIPPEVALQLRTDAIRASVDTGETSYSTFFDGDQAIETEFFRLDLALICDADTAKLGAYIRSRSATN